MVNILTRKCVVCGDKIMIRHFKDRSYKGGHYFGKIHIPTGKGEWVSLGHSKVLDAEICDWTGKYSEEEYWECDKCYFGEPEKIVKGGHVVHVCPDCGKEASYCPAGHWLCYACGWQAEGCDHPNDGTRKARRKKKHE